MPAPLILFLVLMLVNGLGLIADGLLNTFSVVELAFEFGGRTEYGSEM